MPYPTAGEDTGHYVSRFMGSSEASGSFPDPKQRAAVAYSIARQRHLAHALRHGTHRHTPGNHSPDLMTGDSARHPPSSSANGTTAAG